ncbi:MAG: YggS family pyridoxal phosphate-dependent enzyme [Acidimicrobiales bacterium]
MADAALIAERAEAIRARIRAAGGDPARVTLVAVTKTFSAQDAAAALAAGLVDLGENYAQELVEKAEVLAGPLLVPGGPSPRWHFIGQLQRNKVRAAAPYVALWQSIDRTSLADELARRAPGAAALVQVNVTGEAAKGGCELEAAAGLVEHARAAGLDVRGLMAVGPTDPGRDPRPAFERLAALADRLGLAVRSMGMTDDLEAAVACGSTMVRVGRALFGPRMPPTAVRH